MGWKDRVHVRATFMYGAGDVRVENVPDPRLSEPTDAIVRTVLSCICGSDLHMAAKRLGAERIILMGRHTDRTDLGREFGATDVVAVRGDEGIALVRDLTGGDGTHIVLECVGHLPAYEQALGVVRVGGVISRVGVPQYEEAPIGFPSLFGRNLTLTGGPAPVRNMSAWSDDDLDRIGGALRVISPSLRRPR